MIQRRRLSAQAVERLERDAERHGIAGMTVLQLCGGLQAAVFSEADRLYVIREAEAAGIKRHADIIECPMVRGCAA